jgi:hypothetical protein
MTKTPIRAERDGGNLPDRHPLAEKARGQDGRPDRHGEFERHHLCERNQRQRIEPAELGGIVQQAAAGMHTQPGRAQRRKAAGEADQGIQHHEPERRSDFHDLEDVEFACRLAAGDGDHQHQAEPARHPQRGPRF